MKPFSQLTIKNFEASKSVRVWIWIAFASLLLGAFVLITSEVQEASLGRHEWIATVDQFPEQFLSGLRNPKLNEIAINVTALGSATVATIIISIASTLLVLKRFYQSAVHLIVAAIGSGLLTYVLKTFFERPRPNGLAHLVSVQGYSYPSGHSLSSAAIYFTFAVLLCGSYRKWIERSLIVTMSLGLIALIGLSRIYLGVHYVSDVLAGVFIGIGWAALLGAIGAFLKARDETLEQH